MEISNNRILLFVVFCAFLYGNNLGGKTNEKVFSLQSISKEKNSPLIVVSAFGKFGEPEWKSQLIIFESRDKNQQLYCDQTTNELQKIICDNKMIGTHVLNDKVLHHVSYIVITDGLDSDKFSMILIYDGKIYKNSAVIRKEGGLVELGSIQLDETASPLIKDFSKNQWNLLRKFISYTYKNK